MTVIAAPKAGVNAGPLKDFQERAAQFKSVITVPEFETTTNAIRTTVKTTIAAAMVRLTASAI